MSLDASTKLVVTLSETDQAPDKSEANPYQTPDLSPTESESPIAEFINRVLVACSLLMVFGFTWLLSTFVVNIFVNAWASWLGAAIKPVSAVIALVPAIGLTYAFTQDAIER